MKAKYCIRRDRYNEDYYEIAKLGWFLKPRVTGWFSTPEAAEVYLRRHITNTRVNICYDEKGNKV